MKKIFAFILILVGVSFVGATPVEAKGKGSGWVGVTTSTWNGFTGVVLFNIACNNEFPGSRMCNVKEILETVNPPLNAFPPSGPGGAWVQPSIEDPLGKLSGGSNCSNWSFLDNPDDIGTVIYTELPDFNIRYGEIGAGNCGFELHVPCCVPPRRK